MPDSTGSILLQRRTSGWWLDWDPTFGVYVLRLKISLLMWCLGTLSVVSLSGCANFTAVSSAGTSGSGQTPADAGEQSGQSASQQSAEASEAKNTKGAKQGADEPPLPSIASFTEDSTRHAGFFDLYQGRRDGAVYLRVPPSLLDTEFVYTATVTDGVVETGLFRGQYRDNKVLILRRHFDRVEVVQPNTRFYYDPDSPLSRAAGANAPDAVLAVMDIVAHDSVDEGGDGAVLVDFGSVLLSEDLVQIKPPKSPESGSKKALTLGKFSAERSKVSRLASYPENALVRSDLVYEVSAPLVTGGDDVTDARAITASVQHSFIKMPENDYQPRRDDYRVGFFSDRITDLTSRDPAPYRDVINRWHLVKKNPDQAVSDPVEPITWWLENTTPLEFRELITQAALSWNTAFEAAGFSNAIVVKQQPDDAQWDAGDIRYNVLRWTASARPPFGGYGPSFTNPRTGQILGADIMLEFAFLTNRLRVQDLLQPDDASLYLAGAKYCTAAQGMQADAIFAQQAMLNGADPQTQQKLSEQLTRDSIYFLILHEIGHTLGLTHNMRASQLQPDVFDLAAVEAKGLSASVMDYEAVNVAPDGKTQTWFYQKRPGLYDEWALQFGYGQYTAEALNTLLQRSTEPQLAYGNDADDMRRSTNGIDPDINIYDLSSDAIGYAQMRFDQLRLVQARLPEQYQGETYQGLVNAFAALMSQYQRSGRVVSRYVGGIHLNRQPVNDQHVPYKPVPADLQRRAMSTLNDYLFAPDVLADGEDLFARLQPQRRGFDFYGKTEDPKIHNALLRAQKSVLDHLLHPNTLQRLTDSQVYGGQFTTYEMLQTLTDGIFAADLAGEVNSYRQNLQTEYVQALIAALTKNEISHPVKALVYAQVKALGDKLSAKMVAPRFRDFSGVTQAHTAYLDFVLRKALTIQD